MSVFWFLGDILLCHCHHQSLSVIISHYQLNFHSYTCSCCMSICTSSMMSPSYLCWVNKLAARTARQYQSICEYYNKNDYCATGKTRTVDKVYFVVNLCYQERERGDLCLGSAEQTQEDPETYHYDHVRCSYQTGKGR